MASVQRYEVPCDAEWHNFILHGPVVHIASRRLGCVEFWVLSRTQDSYPARLRAFATGVDFPDECVVLGSAVAPDSIAWHLVERPEWLKG